MESGDPADSPSSSPILAVGGVSIPSLQPTTTTTTWTASPHPVVIKWAGKEIELADVSGAKTVLDLKALIHARTGVQVDRQKLLNLSFKGKVAADDCTLLNLNLRPGHKIMMMGSLEKDIENVDVPPEERPEVNNDLDVAEDFELEEYSALNQNKIARRINEYNVNVLNPPRPGKKLLVLDIDYTLFDHRSEAQTGTELMRPFLHEFLTTAYAEYDIAIWSATSMKWIQEKMKLLGVDTHPDYKIVFYLDYLAMITVPTQKYGVINVKPLGVIWGKFTMYTAKNTIMFDDLRRNFVMNPQQGLRIRPFRSAHLNRATDRELLRLATYLSHIAKLDDFSHLNHSKWESCVVRLEIRAGTLRRRRRPREGDEYNADSS
ncbi:ubiquitin-like domain-containing CTD phosphatase 1 [Folsomia candida]|uniref:ubiquitin-like domain-containing CTD phosphatase 1 n=1 Tax=Folsomia candida TaxID=158441 RepID=UPI000B8EFBDC|nr:ubiquitin-like domain-containing CTD phosphatase 1 [Folsomia candida]XP_035714291.1 ubiquitin-like domain-containing CTD phosphatase 1 [Folsomia candida]